MSIVYSILIIEPVEKKNRDAFPCNFVLECTRIPARADRLGHDTESAGQELINRVTTSLEKSLKSLNFRQVLEILEFQWQFWEILEKSLNFENGMIYHRLFSNRRRYTAYLIIESQPFHRVVTSLKIVKRSLNYPWILSSGFHGHPDQVSMKIKMSLIPDAFISDYAIPGTPATDGAKCHFLYYSTSEKSGKFNSPRYPSNYPRNTVCVYEFFGTTNENVRITFEEGYDIYAKEDQTSEDDLAPKNYKWVIHALFNLPAPMYKSLVKIQVHTVKDWQCWLSRDTGKTT